MLVSHHNSSNIGNPFKNSYVSVFIPSVAFAFILMCPSGAYHDNLWYQ